MVGPIPEVEADLELNDTLSAIEANSIAIGMLQATETILRSCMEVEDVMTALVNAAQQVQQSADALMAEWNKD